MKKKRRSNRAAQVAAAALFACLLAGGLAASAERKKPKVVPQAILFGNVFQENGFSLRGARVVVINADHPKDRKETVTNVQGEFAVRVPAGKAKYTVEVSAEGFAPQMKAAEVTGDERIDMTFRLERKGK